MRKLSDDEELRAHRLHGESIVVDTLGPGGPSVYTSEMLKRLDELVSMHVPPWQASRELNRMGKAALVSGELDEYWAGWDASGVTVSSVTMGPFGPQPFTYENAVRDIANWTRTFEACEQLEKVTRAADIERIKAEGKHGLILNFQNTTHLDGDLDNLEVFYNLGVRIMILTYNSRNLAGDGCTERVQAGLTYFGMAMVRQMNDMGILIDLAHCGEGTTLEAIEVSERPVAITHSVAKSIVAHDRAKSDDIIRLLGERGGYFGVCVVPFFISAQSNPTLDDWLRHVERVVELAGIQNVGIGTDWGAELPPAMATLLNVEMERLGFRDEHRVDWAATVEGWRKWTEWPNLTRALVGAGYSDDEIRGFLGGNFLRLFRDVVG